VITVSHRTADTIHQALTAPLLIQSSQLLGWQDIEVQTYLEPAHTDCWVEPTIPDISLILLTQGCTRLVERGCDSCTGVDIRHGDLMLKPAASMTPELRWQSLSDDPIQTLRLRLSYGLFYKTIEELTDRDPARVTLAMVAGVQDPLLLHIGMMLAHELESPSVISTLYAQTAAQMVAVHLLRHYAVAGVVIKEREQGLSAQQLRRITEYVRVYLTRPLSLEELAGQVGFSPYHFARLFRQAVGESPHQFILRQRVDYARQLLRDPDLSISQVAIASGFADQSHLTQIFKRYTGMTPKAFRITT
jgi:AraC family transcriptional regulator